MLVDSLPVLRLLPLHLLTDDPRCPVTCSLEQPIGLGEVRKRLALAVEGEFPVAEAPGDIGQMAKQHRLMTLLDVRVGQCS